MAQAAHLLQQLPHTVLISPPLDRGDWRRWCEGLGLQMDLDAPNALVFDTLEQGMAAPTAVPTGDGYYLVWPRGSAHDGAIRGVGRWLRGRAIKLGMNKYPPENLT